MTAQPTSKQQSGRCPHCGRRERSSAAHGLCFAAIGVAFKNWPHGHRFTPKDDEHLRAWLCWEVDHTEGVEVDLTSIDLPPEQAESVVIQTVKAARSLFDHKQIVRMFRTDSGIKIMAEKSMNYETLGKREFDALADKIYAKIHDETGIDAVRAVKEDRKAA